MATAPRPQPNTGSMMINLYDGTRKPLPDATEVLVRITDGNQKQLTPKTATSSNVFVPNLEYFNGLGDNYTVLVSSSGYVQAGFTPVKISPRVLQPVYLMLLPADGDFNFAGAQWGDLPAAQPDAFRLLSAGVAPDEAQSRYADLRENEGARLACFFNLTTAMADIHLPVGKPLDYIKRLIWDEMAQDRFFAWADAKMADQVALAADQGAFAPEAATSLFHKDATRSWKQIQFGEANVQLTFHENDRQQIDGVDCVIVEPDIDYFKNQASHTLLEVIPNFFSGNLTDPKAVYVLRWIAGHHANVAEFNPPYTIQ